MMIESNLEQEVHLRKKALLVKKPQNKMITMPKNFTKSVVWSRNAVSLTDLNIQVDVKHTISLRQGICSARSTQAPRVNEWKAAY